MIEHDRTYFGDGESHYDPLDGAKDNEQEPYVADDQLVDAVNLALYLKRPLLLEGDPGCGKTRLAYAVAYELGYPLHTCYVRSTTKAADLLYSFDRLERLYDIEEARVKARYQAFEAEEGGTGAGRGDACGLPEMATYRKLKSLGLAVEKAQEKKIPSVVLIDEVDKADIDFPNDLLQVLDEWRFRIDETDEDFDAGKKAGFGADNRHLPLAIVTSNREKELPPAFLRRCLYHYIEFPRQDTMEKIVKKHSLDKLTPLFLSAIRKFMWLRNESGIKWIKPPSTSELILWIQGLEREERTRGLTAQDLDQCELKDLPLPGVVVKNKRDREKLFKS